MPFEMQEKELLSCFREITTERCRSDLLFQAATIARAQRDVIEAYSLADQPAQEEESV
jgi:hypothetical protein